MKKSKDSRKAWSKALRQKGEPMATDAKRLRSYSKPKPGLRSLTAQGGEIHRNKFGDIIIMIPFAMDGLNGPNGLMRQDFRAKKKKFMAIRSIVGSQVPHDHTPFKSGVEVVYIRHSPGLMDWDNAAASFKLVGDALVAEGLIEDDNPSVVEEFSPFQVKSKRGESRTVVILRSIGPGWAKACKNDIERLSAHCAKDT